MNHHRPPHPCPEITLTLELTRVPRLLNVSDACGADRHQADPEERRVAIRAIEQNLTTVVAAQEEDFSLLASRLRDENLSNSTRDAIAGNLGKASADDVARETKTLGSLSLHALSRDEGGALIAEASSATTH